MDPELNSEAFFISRVYNDTPHFRLEFPIFQFCVEWLLLCDSQPAAVFFKGIIEVKEVNWELKGFGYNSDNRIQFAKTSSSKHEASITSLTR